MGVEYRSEAHRWARTIVEWGGGSYHVFRLRYGAKEPEENVSWTAVMTSDPAIVDAWFEADPDMCYGVCPGPRGAVLDPDEKQGKNGLAALLELQAEAPIEDWIVGRTFEVTTPSGGRHYYLLDPPFEVSNSDLVRNRVDVRGAKGYVVGPGSVLVEGICKPHDTPGFYEVTCAEPFVTVPQWVSDRLGKSVRQERERQDPLFELDSNDAIESGRKYIRNRSPAVEGRGGDNHTYNTAAGLLDFGLSTDKILELLTEPYLLEGEDEGSSWNDRCDPPWDVFGDEGTLQFKIENAARYRQKNIGIRATEFEYDDSVDLDSLETEQRDVRSGVLKYLSQGAELFGRGKRQEYIIPHWLLSHGVAALVGRRGGGKSTILIDLALRLSCDMDWHGEKTKHGFSVVYLCGEDDLGAEEHARAWCKRHEIEFPPDRFLFFEQMPDLLSPEDVRKWAEAIVSILNGRRAVVIMDTWQRGTSMGSQSNDEEMQLATHHAEAIGRSVNGPVVVAFHPKKDSQDLEIIGSSIIGNATTAIWKMTEHGGGTRKLWVDRIKASGRDSYKVFKFDVIGLGEKDEFDNERTGVVPESIGGTEGTGGKSPLEARRAWAVLLRDLETRRKTDDPDSKGEYTLNGMAKKIISILGSKEQEIVDMFASIRENDPSTSLNVTDVKDRLKILFGDDVGHDFGDGLRLVLRKIGGHQKFFLEKSGMTDSTLDNKDEE